MVDEDGERICLATASRSRLDGAPLSGGRRTPRSYGSCGSRTGQMAARINVRIIRYRVQPSDTLQGIALKYGVTMEDIKRENRLWTTDSLFLREHLDIPLPASPSGDGAALLPTQQQQLGGVRCPREASPSPQRTVSLDAVAASDQDENIRDFLGRIDTSIKKTKSQIKELNLPADESVAGRNAGGADADSSLSGLTLSTALNSVSYQNHYQNSHTQSLGDLSNSGQRAYSNVDFAPKTVVVTSGRKVKTSLQRHHREHEQMFEL
ncbi:lysM and putative peptidoglycan-binding domain-containing protein 2-like [Tropilaelaps mercedesae]|uniref:LysM and putative peptidoglycan-binding domain-containing protein 2-like n=1 Tax=Tropilaelaps mercedesae TaxID=418985 RepID=A0A1V9XEY7_9ACAR|nr:lysM and putative peptidoglycan-binding domain-containing protein 2-like [Tropilaelaps mercedesae]